MKKKIITVSCFVLAAAVLLAACGKEDDFTKDDSTSGSQSENTTVEYSTEENGDLYVTNVNGEHIPVTTDKNGMMDMYEDLITKTAEQVNEEKNQQSGDNSDNNSGGDAADSTTAKSDSSEKVDVGKEDNTSRDIVIDLR